MTCIAYEKKQGVAEQGTNPKTLERDKQTQKQLHITQILK